MKKFSFSLDRVLDYKSQIEDKLRSEHAGAVKAVLQKEKDIEVLEGTEKQQAEGLDTIKHEGCTIETLRIYENYLEDLRRKICSEKELLSVLNQQEELKRNEVVEAKKERTSIDMLKDKKKKEYDFDVQKEEERLIEEFVMNTMIAQE